MLFEIIKINSFTAVNEQIKKYIRIEIFKN